LWHVEQSKVFALPIAVPQYWSVVLEAVDCTPAEIKIVQVQSTYTTTKTRRISLAMGNRSAPKKAFLAALSPMKLLSGSVIETTDQNLALDRKTH